MRAAEAAVLQKALLSSSSHGSIMPSLAPITILSFPVVIVA